MRPKFIFEQAEKYLKEQIDMSLLIGTKSTTLLTVVSGLLIGLMGFGINRFITSGYDSLIGATIGGVFYLYYIVFILLKNIKPALYKTFGLQPRDLFVDKLFNLRNEEYRMEALYINEIIQCQIKIDFNEV